MRTNATSSDDPKLALNHRFSALSVINKVEGLFKKSTVWSSLVSVEANKGVILTASNHA